MAAGNCRRPRREGECLLPESTAVRAVRSAGAAREGTPGPGPGLGSSGDAEHAAQLTGLRVHLLLLRGSLSRAAECAVEGRAAAEGGLLNRAAAEGGLLNRAHCTRGAQGRLSVTMGLVMGDFRLTHPHI
jgi:hypothetical protein